MGVADQGIGDVGGGLERIHKIPGLEAFGDAGNYLLLAFGTLEIVVGVANPAIGQGGDAIHGTRTDMKRDFTIFVIHGGELAVV